MYYLRDLIILVIVFVGLLFTYFNLLIFYSLERKKRELKDYPKVSIIVPAYNEEENIEKTIKSLLELDYPKDKLEIIIVDDGSKDRTYEIAKKYESDIIKVYRKENGGKASALNYGIKRASGDFIVTLDADSIVPKDALKKMLEYFDEEDVMIVVPAIQITEVKNFWQRLQSIEYSYNNFLRLIFDRLNSLHVAPGPFSVFRREFFEKVGYFDEKNLTEDMEIAMRCQAYGYKIRYCPEVLIKTKAPDNFKSLLRQRLRWYLGFVDNFLMYRNKILNKVLVNLVFGGAIVFIALPIVNLTTYAYDLIKYLYERYVFYSSIDFNVLPIIKQSLADLPNFFTYLKIEYLSRGLFYLAYNILLVSTFLIFINKAWKYEGEGGMNKKLLSLIIYSFFYIFFYSFVWIVVLIYKVFGREFRWGGVKWENSLINKIWK